ncbi:MAG: recombination mediator RecR [Rhodospirillales bacterium]
MSDIERLIQCFARLPGMGPRSARRAVLHLLKRRETVLAPLLNALTAAAETVRSCQICGNLDDRDPCRICADPRRDPSVICVVEDVSDLWALERSGAFHGRYHVLGGVLSALDGVGPEDLRMPRLIERAGHPEVEEVIVALSFTVDGQTTGFYIGSALAAAGVRISGIAHGVPLGGELHHLDDATLSTALQARRSFG